MPSAVTSARPSSPLPASGDRLPARRGGAKALLLTVLGEFVLPSGGAVWTTSLVGAARALGIEEKNARQAIARIGEQGIIDSERHGRAVRWSLTRNGRELLEDGTRRIYTFGVNPIEWSGEWLVAHCPVEESQRTLRTRLRTQLGFLGFGELSPSLLASPHVDRDIELRRILTDLGLLSQSTILRSSTGSIDEDVELAGQAWELDELAASYGAFVNEYRGSSPTTPDATFCSLVGLVHRWRRFPFVDPELPAELLPADWAGEAAVHVFHDRHGALSPDAQRWFAELDAG